MKNKKVVVAGVTPMWMTFFTFSYFEGERLNNVVWVLQWFWGLFMKVDALPGVIVTDRDLALKNALKTVFPDATNLLCRFHINKNVKAKCKTLVGQKNAWDYVMEWQQRKPMMKVCPICGKNAGLSSSSLKLHLQKSHKRLSSGSVDSAMTMEIQKALTTLKISRGGSVSPKPRKSHSTIEA